MMYLARAYYRAGKLKECKQTLLKVSEKQTKKKQWSSNFIAWCTFLKGSGKKNLKIILQNSVASFGLFRKFALILELI